MKGRNKLPKEIKIAQGTYRKNQEHERIEGSDIKNVTPPEYLSDNAKKYFNSIVRLCVEQNTMKSQDIFVCVDLAEVLELKEWAINRINEEGKLQTNDAGHQSVHPAVIIYDKTVDKVIKLSSLLGLSPAAREKIRPKVKQKENALEKLMSS